MCVRIWQFHANDNVKHTKSNIRYDKKNDNVKHTKSNIRYDKKINKIKQM